MDTSTKITAIRWFQQQPNFHPLTCGVDSQKHQLLEPMTSHEDSVILFCPSCGYRQNWVPDEIYDLYRVTVLEDGSKS